MILKDLAFGICIFVFIIHAKTDSQIFVGFLHTYHFIYDYHQAVAYLKYILFFRTVSSFRFAYWHATPLKLNSV